MRKYLLWPAIVSYFVITSTILFIPSGIQASYITFGFPEPFIFVYEEIFLNPGESLLNTIALNPVGFILDFIIIFIIVDIIILLINLILKIIRKKKKPNLCKNAWPHI